MAAGRLAAIGLLHDGDHLGLRRVLGRRLSWRQIQAAFDGHGIAILERLALALGPSESDLQLLCLALQVVHCLEDHGIRVFFLLIAAGQRDFDHLGLLSLAALVGIDLRVAVLVIGGPDGDGRSLDAEQGGDVEEKSELHCALVLMLLFFVKYLNYTG